MGISYKDAIENDLISKKILSVLPKVCICKSKIEFNDSISKIQCTSSDCLQYKCKRVYRLLSKLGLNVKNSEIVNLVTKLNIITPYQIFMLDEVYENGLIDQNDIQNIKEVVQVLKKEKEEERDISNIVEMCGIEYIENIARGIFDGFESFSEAYTEIECGQIVFINNRLGIKNQDSMIISANIYNKIIKLKEELEFAETEFKINKSDTDRLRIAFTGDVYPYINTTEFIEKISYRYNIKFVHVVSINEETDILVKTGNDAGNKISIANQLNDAQAAKDVNNSEIEISDIGKIIPGRLKPLGCSVYIDTLEKVLDRLDTVYIEEIEA